MRAGPTRVAAAAGAIALAAALASCSSPSPHEAAAPHSGKYPVAVAGESVTRVPSVETGGYQLVSAGSPVDVRLGSGSGRVTVSGPDVRIPEPPPGTPVTAATAPGVLTVTVTASRGTVRLDPRRFLGLDEDQEPVRLRPDGGGTARPGHPVTLLLRSTFASGHTTLTWQPAGKPLVTWDFTVEID